MTRFATTKPNGASSHIAGSRNGRGRSGSCSRSAGSAAAAMQYDIEDAAVMKPISVCQPGNGRKTTIPIAKLRIVETIGMPRPEIVLNHDGHQPLRPSAYETRALVPV